MKANGQGVGVQGARALVGAGIQVLLWTGPAQAQPVPLPYRSQAPFLPTIDLFGGPNKGLILGAEEVDRGRPAPVTIGNTTFFPQVRRAGELYGGFTRVNGDLEILHGDLYLGGQAVGATLQQHATAVQQHGTALTQQSATLLQQGAAITGLSTEMQEVKQSITVLDQNLNSLGNGVAGATALASALASLPVDAVQSPLSCGVGSGGYSDRYALAMGCAVHLASSLSLNAGGAYLFGGSSSYGGGSLSDVAGRFGLTYRFGARDDQPTRTAQAQRKLEQDLKTVKDENRALQSMLTALQRRVDLLHAAAAKP